MKTTVALLLLAITFVCPVLADDLSFLDQQAPWSNPALTANLTPTASQPVDVLLAGDDGLDQDCMWVCSNGDCVLECIE